MDELPELRATVPALEPDPVLLAQLVELSAASAAASARRSPLRPVRVLAMGAAALGLVAATSWIAGALPGVPSPIAPNPAPPPAHTTPAAPSRTSDPHAPGADLGPTSGASGPHTEAPGVATPSSIPSSSPHAQGTDHPNGPRGNAFGNGSGKHPDHVRHPGRAVGQHQHRHGRRAKGSPGTGHQHTPTASASPSPEWSSGQPTKTPQPTSEPTTGP
ncbi:hypothetical protein [Nocardioides sp. CER19]|uniref:hypothetical protein n=1 Tax=Nocardioides sp. CER19 TaxID=3038538 RepID=UPI0024487E39|nr:hypothetical protein [Nocardioides sp. CER19]MDH2415053.1 hypothetical protein [Nocardioides sp. CER19]